MECLLSNESTKEKSDKEEKEKKEKEREEKGVESVVVVEDRDAQVSNLRVILVIMIIRWIPFLT